MSDDMKTKPQDKLFVVPVDGYKDLQSKHTASLTASKTITELLGVAISDLAGGVTIITDGGVVNYNPLAAATTAHALLPAVYTALGGKSILETIEVFADSATTIEIIVFGVNQ